MQRFASSASSLLRYRTPRTGAEVKPLSVLWWSRSDREYSRDRIIRNAFRAIGWQISDFRPTFSRFGDLESLLRNIATPDLVWVPCFRQRDVEAAQRWSRKRGVPVVFDPLISAYDKQVFERKKFSATSRSANQLLQWERRLLGHSDLVIADTPCHAEYFETTHQVDPSRLAVIPVSAEEELFVLQPARPASEPAQVLFYGSFIGLQGPQTIAEAATLVKEVQWTFIGSGPLLEQCKELVAGCSHVRFLPKVPYDTLPKWIGKADVLLGVFGTSQKAGRVIPNKVYQSLACGRPVITQSSDAYPAVLRELPTAESAMSWVPPGQPQAIAAAVRNLVSKPDSLAEISGAARRTYENWFNNDLLCVALTSALKKCHTAKGPRIKAAT